MNDPKFFRPPAAEFKGSKVPRIQDLKGRLLREKARRRTVEDERDVDPECAELDPALVEAEERGAGEDAVSVWSELVTRAVHVQFLPANESLGMDEDDGADRENAESELVGHEGLASSPDRLTPVPHAQLGRDDSEKQLTAGELVSVFKHVWRDSWGPRLEYLLYNSVYALMDTPKSTLLGVYRMLVDKEYRDKVVARIKDPMVKLFWIEDFANYDERYIKEIIAPVENKVGQLLTSPVIRDVVGQEKSTIDLRRVMDDGQVLIVNLAKGRIGEDRANLLGSIFVTKLYLAALSRQAVAEDHRPDFYLYVDEFQNFSTDSFAAILSEARKYKLNLTLAHQYFWQVPDSVRHAIFGNVGTIVSFRVGAYDAALLEREFLPYFDALALREADKYEIYYKTVVGGLDTDPSFGRTLPPTTKSSDNVGRETVIKTARQFTKPRAEVERKISKWLVK